jgi:hypothetical protein
MRTNIIAAVAYLAAALSSSAAVNVQAWYHLGEPGTLPGGLPLDSSGNGRHMNDGFSEFESVHISPNSPGGPLGTSGWISAASSEWGRSGDVIIAARDEYYVSGENFGIEAWVLPFGNGYNIFCCEGAHNFTAQIFASGADSTGFYLGVKNNQDGTYSFVAAVITDTNGVAQVGDALPLVTTSWTHLAVVRNNGTNTFYVNGAPFGPKTTDTPSTNVPTGTGLQNGMRLGASGGDQLAFRGLIDEARAFTFSPGQFAVADLLYPSASATVPLVVEQPDNATAWDGGAVPFTVTAASSPSLTYQWRRNGTNISGATTTALFLPNVSRTADNGTFYSCLVSNTASHAFTVSSNATLTVLSVQTNNTANYENLVTAQPSLVAYFPVDNNSGSTLSNVKFPAQTASLEGGATYDGRIDRAFGRRSLALDRAAHLGDATLANNAAYSFPSGVGTIEAIVYMGENGVYINGGVWTFPTIFAIGEADRTTPTFTTLLGVSKTGDALEASADGGTTTQSWPAPSNLSDRFAHVAFVFDQASGITAYLDGRSLGPQGTFSSAASTSPAWIGSAGSYTNSFNGPVWSGTIDELAIYTNALSPGTINAHYAMFVYGTNTPPVILSAPSPVTIFAGAAINSATFSVNAEGTLPLGYQWKSNGVNIAGATSPSYTVLNITAGSSATYSVTVTNPVNSTNVSAALSVITPTGYSAAVIADNPMAYWRLGERAGPTLLDSWGTNNGTYLGTETFGLPGALLREADTSVDFAGNGSSLGRVPYSSDLNGGRDPNGSWTVECWVYPDLDAATEGGLFAVPVASVNLAANRSGYFFLEQADGWQLRLGNSGGYLAGWNGAAGSFGGVAQANTWYHLVGAYDGATGTGYAYVNGVQVKSAPVAGLEQNTAAPFNIGDRGDGAPFAGRVDEVAVYTGVLSTARVQAHYYAGQPPKITVTRSGANLTLTWPTGVLYQANNVSGPYTIVAGATSPYQVTPNQGARYYLLRSQ